MQEVDSTAPADWAQKKGQGVPNILQRLEPHYQVV